MRYAIIHPSFAVHGGAEVLIARLASELAGRGHEVALFSAHTRGSAALSGLDVRLEVADLGLGPQYFDKLSFRDWARVGAVLAPRLLRCDVLCFQGLPSPLWWRAALEVEPLLLNVPSLWFCHGLVGWLYDDVAGANTRRALSALGRGGDRKGAALAQARLGLIRERGLTWTLGKLWRVARVGLGDPRPAFIEAEKDAVGKFTGVLANSELTARNLGEIFGVEAGVCYPGLAPEEIPAAFSEPGRDMLTVARLQFSKNHRGLLEAVAELKRRGTIPFRRYVIAGDGPELGDLRRFVAEQGIGDVVELAGRVTGRDLDALYERAGLFALPAFDEGFGLVYLEAAARARPSLAPDHGGPAEIVVEGETGWLVDPCDPLQMAEVIRSAFSQRDELRRRGLAARRRLLSEFTVERFVDSFEDAVARMVAAKSGGAQARSAFRKGGLA